MAWSDPTANLTFANDEIATHTKLNLIRDDLLETAPAKATTAGGIFVATGANAVAERIPTAAFVAALETTASTSYTDLATSGPSVTVTTGTKAIAFVRCRISNSSAGSIGYVSIDVSGATTIAAADTFAIQYESSNAGDIAVFGGPIWFGTGGTAGALTAGSNTFKLQHRVNGGTGTFQNRELTVIPL